jgi:hypothetical protein
MINIKIIGTPLYQWEVGRRLQIIPLPKMRVDAVHISNLSDTEAQVVKPREENGMIVADIPNIFLQSGENLVVYTVNVSVDSVETLADCTFAVRNRAKPKDYVYTETEVLTWEALDKRIEALERGGGSGGVDPEYVEELVDEYLAENPPAPGKDGADGKDGQNGKDGKDGADGYTPQKGVDYYTPAEKAELVEEINRTVTGDIEAALDGIIAIQNSLIGGGSV